SSRSNGWADASSASSEPRMDHTTARFRPAVRWLQRTRSRARASLLTQRAGHLAAGALCAVLIAGLFDFVVSFPTPIRAVALLVGVASVALLLWKRIVPALRFTPSLTSFALRAERRDPRFKGLLAASVDFCRADNAAAQPGMERALARLVIDQAA